MDYRTLEITLQYAKDLNKVNFISKMDVYVVVSISGGDKNSKQKTKTSVDHDGDADPMWRFPMKFMVEEAALRQNRLMLDFKLKCDRALGDKDIGEVHVPIKDLVDSATNADAGAKKFVSYQVTKPSGKPKGQLTFSYRFREKPTNTAAPPPVAVVHGASPCRPAAARANYPLLLSPPARESPEAFGGYPQVIEQTPVEWGPPQPWCVYPPPPAKESSEAFGGYPQVIEQTPVEWGPPQPWCGYPPEPRRMPPGGDVYPPQPWCGYPQEPPRRTPSGDVYPPQHNHGYLPSPPGDVYPQPWCGYPPKPRLTPPGGVYPPQRCDGFRPPLMQLAPNWWITDWRYEVDTCLQRV